MIAVQINVSQLLEKASSPVKRPTKMGLHLNKRHHVAGITCIVFVPTFCKVPVYFISIIWKFLVRHTWWAGNSTD